MQFMSFNSNSIDNKVHADCQDDINEYFKLMPKAIIEETGVCKCGSDRWHREYRESKDKIYFKCWDCKRERSITKSAYKGFTIKDYY